MLVVGLHENYFAKDFNSIIEHRLFDYSLFCFFKNELPEDIQFNPNKIDNESCECWNWNDGWFVNSLDFFFVIWIYSNLVYIWIYVLGVLFYGNWIQFVENKHSEAHGMINIANKIFDMEYGQFIANPESHCKRICM